MCFTTIFNIISYFFPHLEVQQDIKNLALESVRLVKSEPRELPEGSPAEVIGHLVHPLRQKDPSYYVGVILVWLSFS
jgi:hypothetical protein